MFFFTHSDQRDLLLYKMTHAHHDTWRNSNYGNALAVVVFGLSTNREIGQSYGIFLTELKAALEIDIFNRGKLALN